MGKFTKAEKSWMMYDWANSAYSVIVTTAIFPIYYKGSRGKRRGGAGPCDSLFGVHDFHFNFHVGCPRADIGHDRRF